MRTETCIYLFGDLFERNRYKNILFSILFKATSCKLHGAITKPCPRDKPSWSPIFSVQICNEFQTIN